MLMTLVKEVVEYEFDSDRVSVSASDAYMWMNGTSIRAANWNKRV